jgi:hypothetical protein
MFDYILDVLGILLPGLAILGGIAWVIGRADAGARDGAWRRIAEARRDLHDQERDMTACLTGHRCPDCPLSHYLGDNGAE